VSGYDERRTDGATVKPFLPTELWDIVDPSLRKSRTSTVNGPATNDTTTTPKTRFNIANFSDDESDGAPASDNEDSEAEGAAQEEVDNDFEDDESDNDDYNAEQYFDDGDADEVVEADAEFGDEIGEQGGGEEREFGRDEEFDV
jgi:DNA-directed RNA polymerase III subunit RPC7